MYATAIATWSLRFLLPSPDDFKGIFGEADPPRSYMVFYNITRWIAGNKSWVEGGEKHKAETVKITETDKAKIVTKTTVEQEKIMKPNENQPEERGTK